MSPLLIKQIHVGCVILSITLFIARSGWMQVSGQRWRNPWMRMVPHFIDTVLLLSAVALAIQVQQYPLVQGWLSAKFFALIAYICLGSVSMRPALSRGVRTGAFALALLVFGYIVLVARAHSPWPVEYLRFLLT